MTRFFEKAQSLVARGIPVHPVYGMINGECACGRGDHGNDTAKHPILHGWASEATTDVIKLTQWDMRWPNANVGVPTGPTSGLLVLDVDGQVGEASLAALQEKHGALPHTPTVLTGSGQGRQFYFRWTPACEGLTVLAGFLSGLDYRGQGGQAVAPPSAHRSGRLYD